MNSICFRLKKKNGGKSIQCVTEEKNKNHEGFKIFLLCFISFKYNRNFFNNILYSKSKVVLRIIWYMITFFDCW